MTSLQSTTRLCSWLAIVICLNEVSSPIAAQAIDTSQTITAGVLSDWPPYYIEVDGRPAGYAVDTLDATAARAGLATRYRTFYSWAALQEALSAGEVDVVPSMGLVSGREYLFTSPVDAFHISAFVRRSSSQMRKLDDLRGTVAVVQSNVGISLAGELQVVEPVVFESIREALFRLLAGDVDALIYPAPVVWSLSRAVGADHQIVEIAPALAEVKRAIAVTPGRVDLQARLERALTSFVGSPEYESIYRRWHAPPKPFWTPRRVGALGGAVVLLVALVGAISRYVATRKFDRALRARERTFRGLAEGLAECVMIVSPEDNVIRYVNSRCEEMFGRAAEELLDRPIDSVLPEDVSTSLEDVPQLARLEHEDGTSLDVEITVGPALPQADPPGFLLTVSDVTERLRADERIRFQAHLLDVIGQAVIATDLEGKVLFWNRFAEELYGWTSDEAVGRTVYELTTPREGRIEAAAIVDILRRGETWNGEFLVSRRDGTTFPAQVANAPILDASGDVVGIVGVSADLSARKELEQQLRQSQKLEAIGRLAGGIAHDFNNLLTAIGGHADLALDQLDPVSRACDDILEVKGASERAAELTRQLLAFSRQQTLKPQVLDLGEVARDLEKMLTRLLGETITIEVECVDPLWRVKADRAQIEQVLMNLAVNARDAMPEGGQLTIRLANRTERSGENEDLEWVELLVRDTGRGIAGENLSRIFEPFFTTKEPGKGTGLGLAMVHGVVSQSGGRIDVESEEGMGTAFRILLPRTLDLPPSSIRHGTVPSEQAEGHTILLVEDDDTVRSLVRRVLLRAGYRVIDSPSPSDALDKLASCGPLHLLVTDVMMPRMTGPELAAHVLRARPGLPVLYITGYSREDIWEAKVDLDPEVDILPKPFSRDELLARISETLGEKPPPPTR